MITPVEYLMGRVKEEDLPPVLHANLVTLLVRVNGLLAEYEASGGEIERKGDHGAVSSGLRRPEDNAKVPNPKAHSTHLTCEGVDVKDHGRRLNTWIDANPNVLVKYGLFREDPKSTPTWCHMQSRPVPSGHRTFIP